MYASRRCYYEVIATLYGYMKDENKQLVINPTTAPTVRRVFNEYLGGLSTAQIAERLNAEDIPTYLKHKGKAGYENAKWSAAGIQRMLENEKYKGDAILQKTFSPDFRSHKRVKNEGQGKILSHSSVTRISLTIGQYHCVAISLDCEC